MSCSIKKITKTRICSGDLKHRITFRSATTQASSIDDALPQRGFVVLKTCWAAIETPRGYSKFDGISVDDRPTHIFWVRFDQSVADAEINNTTILFDGRSFRIIEVKIPQEEKRFLMVLATDRGSDLKAESGA